MITDDETLRIATATAQKRYGDTRGLTKVLELSDPAGSYFAMLDEDGEALRIGDAGFFVARADGRVILLGSGNLVGGLYRRFGSPFAGSLSDAEIVAEAVKFELNSKRPNGEW